MSYWNPVSESMPDPREPVLASYINDIGRRQIVIGFWLPTWHDDDKRGSVFAEAGDWYDGEGWYEQQLNYGEYCCTWIHDGNVTHWQSLPKMPD